jgi:hypothetical protein
MHIYDYSAAHPADLSYFSRAMGNISALVSNCTLQHYDFSRARHIVDVGGADGGLLLAILEANPHVHGTVFDRPQVVGAARQAIGPRIIKHGARPLQGISSKRGLKVGTYTCSSSS